jgi:hypothetical protein
MYSKAESISSSEVCGELREEHAHRPGQDARKRSLGLAAGKHFSEDSRACL